MNPYLVFSIGLVICAVVSGSRGRWSLQDLPNAIEDPSTDPALLPHLEKAINDMMRALLAGQKIEDIAVSAPASIPVTFTVEVSYWTLQEIEDALRNPLTSPVFKPYLDAALNQLTSAAMLNKQMDTAVIINPTGLFSASSVGFASVLATKISTWTFQKISAALRNPTTNAAILPYLEVAQDETLDALISGKRVDTVIIATPFGLPEAKPTSTPEEVSVSLGVGFLA